MDACNDVDLSRRLFIPSPMREDMHRLGIDGEDCAPRGGDFIIIDALCEKSVMGGGDFLGRERRR